MGKDLDSRDKATAVIIASNLAKLLKVPFLPVSQRWVVERTFAWIYDYRRLTIDHERLVTSSQAMIRWATVSLMLNKIWDKRG